MKNIVITLLIGCSFLLAGTVASHAQMGMHGGQRECGMHRGMHAGGAMECGAMGAGMMHGKGEGGCGMHRERGSRMMHGMGGMHQPMLRFLSQVNLDAAQKNKIREIRTKTLKNTIRRKADLRVAMIELRELVEADPVDLKAVEKKLKETEGMKTDLHLAVIKSMVDIKAQLTAEQKQKLGVLMGDTVPCGPGMTDEEGLCDVPALAGQEDLDAHPMMPREHMP